MPPAETRPPLLVASRWGLPALAGVVYYFSNPRPASYFDYTLRVASALLEGRLGPAARPPPWLNEFIPFGGSYYSVFPLGAVLTMLPIAVLKRVGWLNGMPAAAIAALLAAAIASFTFLLAGRHGDPLSRRVTLTVLAVFGTWTWCNLALGGAWQLALGFAVAGQLGALHFVLVRRRPLVAGAFFALAFGNRAETAVVLPVFLYLLWLQRSGHGRAWVRRLLTFSAPFALLAGATLAYNHARFGAFWDFGYTRIPQIREEAWFQHGLFTVHAIGRNAREMLWRPWRLLSRPPYLVPYGFGGSIFLSCPYLIFLLRRGARQPAVKRAAWAAILLLTAVLWLHANPGGWQYSYRYGMLLLPWVGLVLLESAPPRPTRGELVLLGVSVAINAYATWLYLWTGWVRP